ncbi:MAG: isocitrate lyase/phosphoenolpyruvate mutase family protein [Acidimicrobiia bacterium]|nr:isocitrate lyase/phosphoenolpyruvate mutase family protein [Acidimicrobiia bacterium]
MFNRFNQLHESSEDPLVLPNCWDVVTARLIEEAGASALATTSAAVAWSMGSPDGNQLDRDLMLANLQRITEAVDVPVSCDIEGGFGDDDKALSETTRMVIGAGAVGVNLEDSLDDGSLRSVDDAARRVKVVREAAGKEGVDLYLNARTDTYLVGDGDLDDTLARADAYLSVGASGVFVPGTADLATISTLTEAIQAPVNILVGPESPPVPELAEAGVRRISAGSSLAGAVLGHLSRAAHELLNEGTYQRLEIPLPWADLNALF